MNAIGRRVPLAAALGRGSTELAEVQCECDFVREERHWRAKAPASGTRHFAFLPDSSFILPPSSRHGRIFDLHFGAEDSTRLSCGKTTSFASVGRVSGIQPMNSTAARAAMTAKVLKAKANPRC
jgi:hypothetical protein